MNDLAQLRGKGRLTAEEFRHGLSSAEAEAERTVEAFERLGELLRKWRAEAMAAG